MTALQLVHSSRHTDTQESDAVPIRALSLIQGGRDPAAEEVARVAAIFKTRDERLAQIEAQRQADRRAHEARMKHMHEEHAAKMKAMDEAHQAAMNKIRHDVARARAASRRRYEADMRAMCGLLVMTAAFMSGVLLGCGMSPIVLMLVPLALGAFYAIRLTVEAVFA